MVMAKIVLVAIALGFAWLNFSSVRRWRAYGDTQRAHRYVPAWLEAELAVVATALLTAASLSSQAPAADVPGEHATPQEVLAVIAPKRPTLTPPARDAFLANAASASDAFAAPSELDRVQNNFNHNIAGLLVFAIGIGAVVDRSGRLPAARHWPFLFLLLAVFLFLYAEPTVWPLGTESFWGTLAVPAVLQHRLATILVVALALFEWRVRAGTLGVTRWRFAFPLLCGVGGAMLLTHSHGVFVNKSEFLIEFSHAVLGLLALLVGVGRWLELRLPAGSNRAGGMLWSACLIATGLVLLFYRGG
jgi:putative copper resistance protein D